MRVPKWYLYTILAFIAVGFLINPFMQYVDSPAIINALTHIVITITFFWIIFNLYILVRFIQKHVEKKAIILPIYFVVINTANILNYAFTWYTDYTVLFTISLVTKTIELIAIIYLLQRNIRFPAPEADVF